MEITNVGNKAIAFGNLTLLPGETDMLPKEFEGNPVVEFLWAKNMIILDGVSASEAEAKAKAEAAAKEAEEKAKAEAAVAANNKAEAKEAKAKTEAEKKAGK